MEAQPSILGALYHAVAASFANEPTTVLDRKPRMADFAVRVEAAAAAFGWAPREFLAAYTANRSDASELALESSPLVPYIRVIAATELLRLLDDRAQPIFDSRSGITPRMDGDYLVLEQDRACLAVDAAGSVMVSLPAVADERDSQTGLSAIIEEDVSESLERSLGFAHGVIERIDPTHRVLDIVLVSALQDVSYMPWRTRAEHAANPNSMKMRGTASDLVVELTPASRSRPTLQHRARELAEDFTTLLRRGMSEQ